jgi:hypothetical protein
MNHSDKTWLSCRNGNRENPNDRLQPHPAPAPVNSPQKATLLGYCGDRLSSRLEFLEVADSEALIIPRGVLCLMGFWSGPAVIGFKNICRCLSESNLPDDFIFRVLDLDGAPHSLIQTLSRHPVKIGGNAEAYWFRDGEIFEVTSILTGTDERIRQLLAEII